MAEVDKGAGNKYLDKNDRASASIEQLQECGDVDSLCTTLVQVRGQRGRVYLLGLGGGGGLGWSLTLPSGCPSLLSGVTGNQVSHRL